MLIILIQSLLYLQQMSILHPRQKMVIMTEDITPSPPFRSNSPRLPTTVINQLSPGPGTYGIPSLDQQKTSKYHVDIKKESSVKKSLEWIFNSTRSKLLYPNDKNPNLGPGCYNYANTPTSHPRSWGKSKRFNEKWSKNPTQIGPGSYSPKQTKSVIQKRGAQSVFKSKTPKAVLFNEHQRYQKLSYIEEAPVLGEDENEEDKKKQKQFSCIFASKVPRFMTEIKPQTEVGPGSYELTSTAGNEKSQRYIRVFRSLQTSQDYNEKIQKKQRLKSLVGPGSYNSKKHELSYDLEYKGLSFCKQTRFNLKHSRNHRAITQFPGPGQYMKQKYVYSKQIEPQTKTRVKLQGIKNKIISKQPLSLEQGTSEQMYGPGAYKLNQFNIDQRLKKIVEHQRKLKVMEISLAAFSSKVPRFEED